MVTQWEELLPFVQKPGRYLSGEVNSVHKETSGQLVRFALAFPDVYEVGMSHLGLQILYAILNSEPDVAAERCYAPWPDMEALLRSHNLPLTTLESGAPLCAFDVVGFSLQYELSYTNVLAMLELGRIPLHSRERKDGDPIVIAGGPCAYHPAPMAPFLDAVVVGEAEEVILEIAAVIRRGRGKRRGDVLMELAQLAGLYVPALHEGRHRIRKRIVANLDDWPLPARPIVPLIKTIHDRVVLEIARGCTRGCRFCQAGMVWRPVRERDPAVLLRMAEAMLGSTGYDELSLLSLSAGDYACIEALLSSLMDRYGGRCVSLALPSLRPETLTGSVIETIKRVRKTSFTLAPEAGSQRLRDIINKDNTEEDLLLTAQRVFAAGWQTLKLYFMIGLPGETEADLESIAALAYRVLNKLKHRGQLVVSISTFVPKPHTPFQWQEQLDVPETVARQLTIKKLIRSRNLSVKWHDARMSLLEGMLCRGEERLAKLVEEAYRRGCRFDGWSDQFHFERWQEAMAALGIEPAESLRPRRPGEALPWERIDCGLSQEFLLAECHKALRGQITKDCRNGVCTGCGVCDSLGVSLIQAQPTAPSAAPPLAPRGKAAAAPLPSLECRYLFVFVKRGPARFLAHLDVTTALLRAIIAGGITLAYSQGFHPHPRVSFATATAVGMESTGEYGEMILRKPLADPAAAVAVINGHLPAGIAVTMLEPLPMDAPSLTDMVIGFRYEVSLAVVPEMASPQSLLDKIAAFLAAATFPVTRKRKGQASSRDLRPFVEELALRDSGRTLVLSVRNTREGTVGLGDILTLALGFTDEDVRKMRLVKTETRLRQQEQPTAVRRSRRW